MLAFVVLPAIPVLLDPKLRRGLFSNLPLAIILQFLWAGVLACAAYRRIPFGWGKYFFVFGGGALLVYALLRARPPKAPRAFENRRLLGWLAVLALVATVDVLLIFARQGWGFDDGSLVSHATTYFRAPFNSDNERNVIILNALVRHTGSPLLPQSSFTYQLFWYHLVAPIHALFDGLTLFQVAQGITYVNAVIFFFCLFWGISRVRPRWFLKPGRALLVALFVGAHADLFHFAASVVLSGTPGIEADWSRPPLFFRNFSLKMLALTSPQHLTFLLFALGYLLTRGTLLFVGAFLTNPLMAIILFPMIWGYRFLRKPDAKPLVELAVGIAAYYLLLGSPLDLFTRPGVNRMEVLQGSWLAWLGAPLFLVAALGTLGLVTTALLVGKFRREGLRAGTAFYPLALIAGGLFSHYVVTSLEARRHVAMVFALLATFFVARAWPKRPGTWLPQLVFAVTFVLHGYFIYCFVGKPSSVRAEFPWKDYFSLAKLIEQKFPNLPVLAATEPFSFGVIFSPLNETTTSFAFGGHGIVHSTVTEPQRDTILKMQTVEDVPPFAKRLGYTAIAWGPIEDAIWGSHFKARFTSEKRALTRVGNVVLYQLADNLEPDLRKLGLWDRPENNEARGSWHLARATFFEKRGWPGEALEEFEKATWRRPDLGEAYFGLGRAFQTYRRYSEAIQNYEQALKLGVSDDKVGPYLGAARSKGYRAAPGGG